MATQAASGALVGRLPATFGSTDFQAFYDDQLDVTWLDELPLPDMETTPLAQRFGGDFSYRGFHWRLPSLVPSSGAAFQLARSFDGSTDVGFARPGEGWRDSIGNPTSELGHLWYVTLGNGPCGFVVACNFNRGPFDGIPVDGVFHLGNTPRVRIGFDLVSFHFHTGEQTAYRGESGGLAWLVHSGDVNDQPGLLPTNPVLPDRRDPDAPICDDGSLSCDPFRFDQPVVRRWYDPPFVGGFEYELVGDSPELAFREIAGPPAEFGFGPLALVVDGVSITTLSPGEAFDFQRHGLPGVRQFSLVGLQPAIDASLPGFERAFPTFLDWNGIAEELHMTPLARSHVPEPSPSSMIALAMLLGATLHRWGHSSTDGQRLREAKNTGWTVRFRTASQRTLPCVRAHVRKTSGGHA